MIIVRIWEGLGNQLFQYAYARSLQQRTSIPVFLDVRHNNRGDLPCEKRDIVTRKVGIQQFNISLKGIRTDKISALRCIDGTGADSKLQYLLLRRKMGKWRIIDDAAQQYDIKPDIFKPKTNTYINAHCVNKRYYEDCRDILLQELQPKKGCGLSEDLRAIFQNKNTVSIHIRLTDYLRDPSVICRQPYYNRAVQYIQARVEDPYFIVFTDDYELARKMYQFHARVYWIGQHRYKDYEELIIMSKCKHNIIAQSTFSYWGAWLNQNPEKIVVAPRQMFGSLCEKSWKIV